MKLRNIRREPGFYHVSMYAAHRKVASVKAVEKPKSMNKSKPKKNAPKKTSIKSKDRKAVKSVDTYLNGKYPPELNSDFECFKNNFQYEIIKSLSTAGLSTRSGSFGISKEIANELRKKYRINCRFSPENSEK
jgi:hypothetical protein